MRFGLLLPTQGPFADVRLLTSLAHDAERAGWDGVFIWDELLAIAAEPGQWLAGWHAVADPWVALTAIAAATERVRIGTLVSPVGPLRPETFALQTATLDRFSNGRLVIGAGLGNPPEQFSAFGHDSDIRVRARDGRRVPRSRHSALGRRPRRVPRAVLRGKQRGITPNAAPTTANTDLDRR